MTTPSTRSPRNSSRPLCSTPLRPWPKLGGVGQGAIEQGPVLEAEPQTALQGGDRGGP